MAASDLATEGQINALNSTIAAEVKGKFDKTGGTITGGTTINASFNVNAGGQSFAVNGFGIQMPIVTVDGLTINQKGFGEGLTVNHNGTSDVSGRRFERFTRSTDFTVIGSITQNGTTGVAYNTASDERLKDRVGAIEGALARIKGIQVNRFRWKENGQEDEGFFAQQLQNHAPGAVTEGGDDPATEPWQVDHSKLVPLLVAAVQELSARVDELTNPTRQEPNPCLTRSSSTPITSTAS